MGKISPPPGFDTHTVQPLASRYSDYAIPAHFSLLHMQYVRAKASGFIKYVIMY